MADSNSQITVEVAYALPDKQILKVLTVPVGTTALEAVKQSGVLQLFSEIDIEATKMGIFSQVLGSKGLADPANYQLKARDRVEIYRALIADPKEVRRRRAEESKMQKSS
ncbi:MAG: RnfH family protein [Porticoccaceae bacterium]|jgi:putative ubiquitin-RnfH superfamily antitoxin RatB of RatAB toxin-antitoxin module|nr:RnfH family protein [Porticoccaceae bacterium]RPG83217.1 MAG: RnfH family protein [Cellvibrionales bacterium TMED47]|tara:strand:- start:303 stop:632 length:330 start_codon:yes stop_codon:yes gene_type:complete